MVMLQQLALMMCLQLTGGHPQTMNLCMHEMKDTMQNKCEKISTKLVKERKQEDAKEMTDCILKDFVDKKLLPKEVLEKKADK